MKQRRKMQAEIKDSEAQFYYDLYEDLLVQSRSEAMDRQARIDDLCAQLRSESELKRDNKE